MPPTSLILEKNGPLATLTLNRPQALNALNATLLAELVEAVRDIGDDANLRAVIVTGAGDKAFAAGADIREMAGMGPDEAMRHARRGQDLVDALQGCGKVTIAAINGYALGGGTELALACDLRIASENALLGLPEVGLGVIPGFGGTQRLARLVGPGRAKELIFTGRRIPASEAERIGLVNRVVAREKLMDEARRLAEEILANGPRAVWLAKNAIDHGIETDLATGLALEREAFGLAFATMEQKEGMQAFLEKRKAQWPK
ncbi:MAG: enoyl-CoA hydratase-related protein [Thermoplasmatota archaeon]